MVDLQTPSYTRRIRNVPIKFKAGEKLELFANVKYLIPIYMSLDGIGLNSQ